MHNQLPHKTGVPTVSVSRYLFAIFVSVSISAIGMNTGELQASPVYVGSKFCRTCHSSADNNRYHNWLQTGHAKAFEVLTGAEKINPECLSCHTTGYGQEVSDKTTSKDLRGVQCEACHGPGSEYKRMKIMKNPALSRNAGLWNVTRDVCLKCHR